MTGAKIAADTKKTQTITQGGIPERKDNGQTIRDIGMIPITTTEIWEEMNATTNVTKVTGTVSKTSVVEEIQIGIKMHQTAACMKAAINFKIEKKATVDMVIPMKTGTTKIALTKITAARE